MSATAKTSVTIQTTVNVPVEKAWTIWSGPEHITHWAVGSPDWHTPYAENDLRTGGKFLSRMAAKDGSVSFDFTGTYDAVSLHHMIMYTMEDRRRATATFAGNGNTTVVTQTFECETENTPELQREGWQTILNNFKQYAESLR